MNQIIAGTGLEPQIAERVEKWMGEDFDAETRQQIEVLIRNGNKEDITDAFYRDLEFGTGGLRGIIGAGTNRVNKYTIGAATQGLANYLKKTIPSGKIKVAVAHDNRILADVFARITADVFTANGIEVLFFESLRPTPELSFAIRHYGCHSGVMLTASHNPKEYSGYKVYWNNGGQIVAPHDKNIIREVMAVDSVSSIRFKGNDSLLSMLGKETDELFIQTVVDCITSPEAVAKAGDLKIVYSPIHGTGRMIVPMALEKAGFKNVFLVEEQCTPDGNFPTVIYPNPEEKEAMNMSLQKAKETGADIVLATDPDADRAGVAVPDGKGDFMLLNGNQTAAIIFHYLLNRLKEKDALKGDEYVVKTIVTSGLIDEIARKAGVKCYNVLTGFKYIGELMTSLEGKEKFLVGAEESYGYLVGDHVRDKDAVVSCVVLSEIAAWYKLQGKTLLDALREIYTAYGTYLESLISITKKGMKGAEEIKNMMAAFRKNPPVSFAGEKVIALADYSSSVKKNLLSGEEEAIRLPVSNVLQFITEKGSVVSARPSGTEPKIKFYISVHGEVKDGSSFSEEWSGLESRIAEISKDLLKISSE